MIRPIEASAKKAIPTGLAGVRLFDRFGKLLVEGHRLGLAKLHDGKQDAVDKVKTEKLDEASLLRIIDQLVDSLITRCKGQLEIDLNNPISPCIMRRANTNDYFHLVLPLRTQA